MSLNLDFPTDATVAMNKQKITSTFLILGEAIVLGEQNFLLRLNVVETRALIFYTFMKIIQLIRFDIGNNQQNFMDFCVVQPEIVLDLIGAKFLIF